MDYPVGNYCEKLLDTRMSLAAKIALLLIAIWLLNVLFVTVHEAGHTAFASSFGARIYNVYVSPLGLDGSTTHTVLEDKAETCLVLAGGALATTLAIVVAYFLRFDIGVIALGLRTVECLLNYTRGSDMAGLFSSIGEGAYLLSFLLVGVIVCFAGSSIYRGFFAGRVPAAAKTTEATTSTPVA